MALDLRFDLNLKGLANIAAARFQLLRRIEEADINGDCSCCSCVAKGPFDRFHGGHFVAGRSIAVLFEPDNVWPQCPDCNIARHGNIKMYRAFLVDKIGEKRIVWLESQRHKNQTLSRVCLALKVEDYEKLIDQALKSLGLGPKFQDETIMF